MIDFSVLYDMKKTGSMFGMQRARMVSLPLPKGTLTNLRRRDWGIERSHITPKGNEICTPALYEKSNKVNRKFKIMTSTLIDLGYVD
tara:strand:- start:171 stop:431 length:261 start_codon:yes stop_codon:yes gene_type:complete